MNAVAGPLRRDRRAQILDAAEACFLRRGLQATRVEDILLEAGISRATFYRHFANIDAVLMRLAVRAGQIMMSLAVTSARNRESDPVRRIARVIAEMAGRPFDPPILTLIVESAELARLSNLVMLSSEDMTVLAEPLVPLLKEGIAAGALRADLPVEQMIEWLTRNSTSIHTRLPPWAHEVPALVDYALDFVMPALLPRVDCGLALVLTRLEAIEARLDASRD